MTLNRWRVILTVVLCVALTAPARAESLETAGKQIVAGIVVVSVGGGVLVTYLIVHHAHTGARLPGVLSLERAA